MQCFAFARPFGDIRYMNDGGYLLGDNAPYL